MTETDGPSFEGLGLGQGLSAPTEDKVGFAAGFVEGRHLLPTDAGGGENASTDAKSFGYRLLGGEAHREFGGASATEADLIGCVNPLEESIAVALQQPSDTGDLDEVDAGN